jgi:hypothetical protein
MCFIYFSLIHVKKYWLLKVYLLEFDTGLLEMDLLMIDWSGVDWIGLAQDRDKWKGLLNVVMNLRVP